MKTLSKVPAPPIDTTGAPCRWTFGVDPRADVGEHEQVPLEITRLHPIAVWRDSVRRIRSLSPERMHFCHHTDVVHR